MKETNLLARVLLASQLHFAHATGADSLAQYPFAGWGRDSGTGFAGMLRCGSRAGASRVGRAMTDRGRPDVVGDSSADGHVGGAMMRMMIRSGTAVTLRTRGVGTG